MIGNYKLPKDIDYIPTTYTFSFYDNVYMAFRFISGKSTTADKESIYKNLSVYPMKFKKV